MKRCRGALASNPKSSVDVPAKSQRRHRDATPKTAAMRSRPLAASPEKLPLPKRGRVEENRPAATVLAAPSLVVDEATAVWDLNWAPELEGWWCWWGVEEDKLSGWFPFEEEDFIGGDRGGGGVFWEEEDHDIWQLQQIHEIPTSGK